MHIAPYPDKEIIVVDGCSCNGTREKLQTIALSGKISRTLYHEVNQGKGATLRTGIQAATASFVIIQNAHLKHDPNEYNRLIEPIRSGKADAVFGSRFIGNNPYRILYY